MDRFNQFKCTSLNCEFSSAELQNILDHVKITHTLELVFNFECVNRLPSKCRRKFLSFSGLEKHLLTLHPIIDKIIVRKILKCDLCESTPSTVKELKSHYINHWSFTKEPIKCIFTECAYKLTVGEPDISKVKINWTTHCSKYHPKVGYQTEGNYKEKLHLSLILNHVLFLYTF
jgi:hypothetical protein